MSENLEITIYNDGYDYAAIVAELRHEHDPRGPAECLMVDELAGLSWRLALLPLLKASSPAELDIDDACETRRQRPTHAELDGKAAQIRAAIEILGAAEKGAYENALALLPDYVREWWAARDKVEDCIFSDEESPQPDVVSLMAHLAGHELPSLVREHNWLLSHATTASAAWKLRDEIDVEYDQASFCKARSFVYPAECEQVAADLLNTIKNNPYTAALAALPDRVREEWLQLAVGHHASHEDRATVAATELNLFLASRMTLSIDYVAPPEDGNSKERELDTDELEFLSPYQQLLERKIAIKLGDLLSLQAERPTYVSGDWTVRHVH